MRENSGIASLRSVIVEGSLILDVTRVVRASYSDLPVERRAALAEKLPVALKAPIVAERAVCNSATSA